MSDISDTMDMPAMSGKRVLVVDASQAVTSTVRDVLVERCYEVDIAPNGKEALKMYMTGRYACILAADELPGMAGVELLREIKNKGNGVPVVLMAPGGEAALAWRQQGFAAYLRKPFNRDQLFDCICKYVNCEQ